MTSYIFMIGSEALLASWIRTGRDYSLAAGVALGGFCEELVFRGYLQRQFHAATRSIVAAVALQAIVFGLVHTYQG